MLAYVGPGVVDPARPAPAAHSVTAWKLDEVGRVPRVEARAAPSSRRGSVPRTLAAATPPATYRIAYFGDSVTVGAGSSGRGHGYVAHVSRWLQSRGSSVTATVNAKGGVPVAYWEHAPVPKRLDAAVVELGTNDVRLGTPAARFVRQYRTLTSRIRAANPGVRLLCLSVWPRVGRDSREGAVNTLIRDVCPGTYVDITRLRDRPSIRSSDGFHPNDVGYRLIARAVESGLTTS